MVTDEKPRTRALEILSAGGSGVSLPSSAREVFGGHAAGREPARSLYIHVPFCVHKCHYCDFYSFVDQKDQQAAFVRRLIEELVALAPFAHGADGRPVPLRTIFIGGGTPSLLRVELWDRLLAALHEHYDLSLIAANAAPPARDGWQGKLINAPAAEFTVECNPESTTAELLALLRSRGVGRVSIGAQSFHRHHLQTLERRHNPENVARAVELAREAGIARQSIDLIYAIPGQTLEEWRSDLERGVALKTTHLSCYNLTYEPNTAMTARMRAGEFVPVGEDLEADMFELTDEVLTGAGLARYEVSNYARPGHESRHNLAYWWQEQWLAAGPSASGHYAGERWKNRPALNHYLDFSDGGFAVITGHERADGARAVRERIMTGIRLVEGLEFTGVQRDAEAAAGGSAARLAATAQELASDGLLINEDGRLRVTGRGWLMADFLARRLMQCV